MENDTLAELKDSLMYLNVAELKEIASRLALVDKGTKGVIIYRILHFFKTGQKLSLPQFPKNSCAQPGIVYLLGENELMLKGAYKNDLNTRMFFKKLIGDYFHFTAFGIDWLNERWMEGNPPTYREFASMWAKEYKKRKEFPAAPKEEWAYINFTQRYLAILPAATREDINNAWKLERQKQKIRVDKKIESLKLL